MGGMRNVFKALVGKSERGHSEDLGIDGMIILGWILRKKLWTACIWLRIGTSGGLL
jgi:hypothetical protein